jgi:hypothetical protein
MPPTQYHTGSILAIGKYNLSPSSNVSSYAIFDAGGGVIKVAGGKEDIV